jgi:hypothetical protein
MSVQSFTCDEEFCGKYREEIRLDETFCCPRHKRCLGHKLLIPPPLPPPRPFWKTPQFVAALALALIMASGLIFGSFVHARLKTAEPMHSAVKVDLRFESQRLVASAQNLLRLWEAKFIAHDTAQTKRISAQRVSPVGRTAEQSLDRFKATARDEGQFSDIAQQREKEILSEMSNYLQIAKGVAAFSPAAIEKEFDSFREHSTSLSSREELAIGLARRHALQQAEGQLELKQVYSDYESAAFR